MRIRCTLALALGVLLCGPVSAESLWNPKNAGYYSDRRARQVGDLLTVVVVENVSGSNQANSQTSKQNKFTTGGGPGTGLFKFLHAFSADANSKNDFNGSGQADVSSKLNAQITVRVIKVEPNGILGVEGHRLVAVNHDQQELVLSASVRPEDVRGDNTVLSTYLADANIAYHGHGPNAGAQHQGFISRVLNWIF